MHVLYKTDTICFLRSTLLFFLFQVIYELKMNLWFLFIKMSILRENFSFLANI